MLSLEWVSCLYGSDRAIEVVENPVNPLANVNAGAGPGASSPNPDADVAPLAF